MNKDFRQLVAEKFPAGIDNLHNLLGTTKNRVTKLLKAKEQNWKDMSADEVAVWAEVLGMDRSDLIMQYGCGKRGMSVEEAEHITSAEGVEIFPNSLPHVA